jgi:hypothetical protein
MIRLIGLMDYDALYQRRYIAPNYDLGLVYAHLKDNPNYNVRLVTSLSEQNLMKYDEILIFKISKYLPHPSSKIKDYYKLNIKEYGDGFINRERRPYFKDTFYIRPDFTCYNPILQLSVDKPRHKLSWNVKKAVKSQLYTHVRLFEQFESEWLRRDLGYNKKKLAIHDNPADLLIDPGKVAVLDSLTDQGYHFFFTQPLDISLLNDTNIVERVVTDSNWATMRTHLMLSSLNEIALWFVNYYVEHKCRKTDVVVLYEKGKSSEYYLRSMLDLNYLNHQTGYSLRLRPYYDKEVVMLSPLTHCAYRFLYETPYLMSYYEYVFYMGCKNMHVPEKLIRTNEEVYDFILTKYGMPDLVKELELWLRHNPEYEEQIFIGGSSKYEECRRKSYDVRRGNYAFDTRIS